jgi:hypothetical protein
MFVGNKVKFQTGTETAWECRNYCWCLN